MADQQTLTAPRKPIASKIESKGAAALKSGSKLAAKAAEAGQAVCKAGAEAAKPLIESVKQEEPQTLAKMALAAIVPGLVTGALRYALRNPLAAGAGILLVSAFVWANREAAPEPVA